MKTTINRIYKTTLGWQAIEYKKGSQIWTVYQLKGAQQNSGQKLSVGR